LIDNLVYALYGTITKSVINRRVVWNIPCDPSNTAIVSPAFPRLAGEGLLCYIIRVFEAFISGGTEVFSPFLNWTFTGNGSTTTYALPDATALLPAAYLVYIDGVVQAPVNYTIASGNPLTIVFSTAIPNGSQVVIVCMGTASTGEISTASVVATGSTAPRTLANRFADVVNVKDFGAKGDGVTDDTAAIQAAINSVGSAGATIFFPTGTYLISSAITVLKDQILFTGSQAHSVTIQQSSTTQNAFTVGNASEQTFNITFNGIVFTRSSICTAGAAISATTTIYLNIQNCRFFGNNKAWQHVNLNSVYRVFIIKNQFDSPIKESVYCIGGGNAQGGVPNSQSTDVILNDNLFSGGHSNTLTPTSVGVVYFGNYCQGLFLNNNEFQAFEGYSVMFKGLANVGDPIPSNTLVFILNHNVESTFSGSGGLSFDYYYNVVITHGWITGKDLDAISHSVNCNSLQVANVQLAIAGTNCSAVYSNGNFVSINSCDILGYNFPVSSFNTYGVNLGPLADNIQICNNKIRQFKVGIYAGNTAGKEYLVLGNILKSNTTNISNLAPADYASIDFWANQGLVESIQSVFDPSYVNNVAFYGSASGVGPQLFVQGSDANINFTINTKGTGVINLKTGAGTALALDGGALTSQQTPMFLLYHNGTSVVQQRVTVGAAGSGGTGFRQLIVPN
jgi:hypothetical protein